MGKTFKPMFAPRDDPNFQPIQEPRIGVSPMWLRKIIRHIEELNIFKPKSEL